MNKRTVSIELWEDGSRTHLAEIVINKALAKKLFNIGHLSPRLTKAIFRKTMLLVEMLNLMKHS